MRTVLIVLLGAAALAACASPTKEQARVETRYMPVRADTMLAVAFVPGVGQLDGGQVSELRAMVAAGQRAQRDEFVVVTDGSGGGLQQQRADQVRQSLISSGARWVDMTVEPSMAMGPDTVVVARSEYRIGMRNCPEGDSGAMWNPNESTTAGYGCSDAYNMGQMLSRPRDAVQGRSPGPADATVNAAAIERYREGRVRSAAATGGGATPTAALVSIGSSSGGSSSSPPN